MKVNEMRRWFLLAAGVLVWFYFSQAPALAAYTVNANGTVTDSVTTLIWQQTDDGTTRTWEQALTYCEGLTLAGKKDWRLPDRLELQSLVDYSIPSPGPTIDTTAFPGAQASYYWSSTSNALYSSYAWIVSFRYGYVYYDDYNANIYYARCVRGGPVTAPVAPSVISQLAPVIGPKGGGTAVTISGQGFGTAQGSVTLGGQAAVVNSWSATTIHLTTPAHGPGQVDVVVTLADNTTVTKGGGYTYQNAQPTATATSVTTNEDTPVSGQVTGADADGDAITFAKATDPAHGQVTMAANGGFTYTPVANYHGQDTFTVTASDGSANSAPATVTVTVKPVNDPPIATAATLTTKEDTALNATLSGTDPDGAPLTFAITANPNHGTATLANATTGAFSYTPEANYSGPDTLSFTVSDGTITTAAAQIAVTVQPVNDPPLAMAKSITAYQGVGVNSSLQGSDVEGAVLTFATAANPAHGTVTVQADGSFSYTPATEYSGPDAFTFTVSDGVKSSTPAQVLITVLSDPDVDQDGINNDQDPDDDNDGLFDLEESLIGSNPYAADTDSDGLADAVDPAPLVNHFASDPEAVPAITSQEEPFAFALGTLYQDSVDAAGGGDRWYSLTIGPDGAGIHHLLVKPVDQAEKSPGAGRLICTVYAQQPDGQMAVVRTSELSAVSLQAFRLPLTSGAYLLQVAAKELYYAEFQLIGLHADRLYDMTLTANKQGQARQPLVIPAAGTYRLYAQAEGGVLDGAKAVTAALYAGKITGQPIPEKMTHALGTAEEFSTTLNLKSGLVTLAVSAGGSGQGVRFWLDQAGGPAGDLEFEPNQTIAEADSLAGTGTQAQALVSRSGLLSSAGDSDCFGLLVGQADDQSQHSLTITATLTPGTKPEGSSQQITLFSASGAGLKMKVMDSTKLTNSITTLLASGVYYLKLADLTDDAILSTGTGYTLTVSDANGLITPLPKAAGNDEAVLQQYSSLLSAILFQEEWTENGGAIGGADADPYGEAIVVAGVGDDPNDGLYNATQQLADSFYYTATVRGFSDEAIWYLNANQEHDIDGDGFNDPVVDNSAPSKQGVLEAIAWAGKRQSKGPLYLYLVDHGGKQQFLISAKKNELLSAAVLDAALDAFQEQTKRPVVVIIEACYSGSFVATLTNGNEKNRAVFTSAGATEPAMIEPGGSVAFTRFFYKELFKGKGLAVAFATAQQIIKGTAYQGIYQNQNPQAVTADLGLQKLGLPFALADSGYETAAAVSKFINAVGANKGIVISKTAPKAQLAATIFSVSGIKRVWATVLPPGYLPPAISQDFSTPDLSGLTVELKYNSTSGSYQAEFTPPKPVQYGTYTVTYFLEDLDGEIVSTAASPGGDGLKFGVLAGWNLLGARMPIAVDDELAAGAIASIWKWTNNTWAVRLPGDSDKGAGYALGKGFTLLTAIGPGEGFWVNSQQPLVVTPSSPPTADAPLTLAQGWNLVSLKAGTAQAVTTLVAGKTTSVASLWKWGNGGWAVRLPGNEDGGEEYAKGKGFTLLNTINPGEGFWVNALEALTLP
jgi:VCBS repeat-containing protein